MSEKFFLDTNILLCAADGSDQAKQKVAQSLIFPA
jgi:predicted nucleic acid-binding protein